MILKASQRGGGQNLAAHLTRLDDNEHLSVHDLRGFASDNLKDAFKEVEAISRGTKCSQYLFSLSLSPPEHARVSVGAFEDAVNRVEKRLGLEGQPRAIVFHEKDGRRHAHCVWSRIDAETMTARPMPFFKNRLMALSRELYLENGWKMPRGLESVADRNPTNFTLAEWQQAKRQGVDPRWIKQAVQTCWTSSDNLKAFVGSLQERGFALAKGDRRGFVVLDFNGEVYSLPRLLDQRSREVRSRLGDDSHLPSVEEVRRSVSARMTPALRRHIAESRSQFDCRYDVLKNSRDTLKTQHRQEREQLALTQSVARDMATRTRTARLPRGLRGLWHRLTGQYQEVRRQNEKEAAQDRVHQATERQRLIDTQLVQRTILQKEIKELRAEQAVQLVELRKEIGRFLHFSRGRDSAARERDLAQSLGLRPNE